jgi:8-oxo-dGTP pyrophosphatase MutT (NUDIX family)
MESPPSFIKKSKPRAVIVLIENDSIAMIERRRYGQLFYVFPGGGAEKDETPAAAAEREAREELGLEVKVIRLIAKSRFLGRLHYYFLVKRTGGEFGTGDGKELSRASDSERGSVTPIWLSLPELRRLPILPERMAQYVSQCVEQGWPDEVLWFDEQEE